MWQERLERMKFPVLILAGLFYSSFNTIFFPHGLSLMLLLGLFLWPFSLINSKILQGISLYLVALFFLEEQIYEPNRIYFLRSSLLFLAFSTLFVQADSALRPSGRLAIFMHWVSAAQVILILGYCLLWFTPWKNLVWWTFFLSPSVGDFTRLKGLGYEPSYFALMLAPFFLYQLSLFIRQKAEKINLFFLFVMGLGLVFSFSMGVLASVFLSGCVSLFYFRKSDVLALKLPVKLPVIIAAFSVLLLAAFLLFPDAALFLRLKDIVTGRDLSANNRLLESFMLAGDILGNDRFLFGLGPGQLKQEGFFFIKAFYNYQWNDSWAPSMPNSVSDWLCNFGLLGLAGKFLLILMLFFKRNTGKDFFRFLCFAFIFIYQFTGGYLFCLPELMLWIFAFAEERENKI